MTMFWSVVMLMAGAAEPAEVMQRVQRLAQFRPLRQVEAPPQIPMTAYRRAAIGRVETGLEAVDGVRAKKAWGVTVVDVPIAALWSAINSDARHVDYTKMTQSLLIAGERCVSPRSLLQFLPVPLITDRWWITNLATNAELAAASHGEVQELYWTSSVDPALVTTPEGQALIAEGMPLAFTKGAWLLASIDATSTLVEYYVWTDPGGRVPAGPASSFAAGGISDTIEGMVRLAGDHPDCFQ